MVNEEDRENAIVWRPPQSYLDRSRLQRLIEQTGTGDYHGLLDRIAADPQW
jgi:hypothetical protein